MVHGSVRLSGRVGLQIRVLGSEESAGTIDGQLLRGLDVVRGFAGLGRRRGAGVAWTDQMASVLLALQLLGDLGANF